MNRIEQLRQRWQQIYDAADALEPNWTLLPVSQWFAEQVTQALGWPRRQVESVHRALSDPDQFSPYVDEIAVERAVNFDWPVIRRLTRTETSVFMDRLAEHPDWKGAKDADLNALRHDRDGRIPERFAQWLRGTPMERETIERSVHRRLAERRAS